MIFEEADITQIANAIVTEMSLGQLGQGDDSSERLGYTEAEAAELIGVAKHVLRDARYRSEISAKLVGKKYIYTRESLIEYLRSFD